MARQRAAKTIAVLQVADLLAGGPAASLGVLSYEGDQKFGLTGTGQLLRAGVPGSLRDLALAFTASGH